MPFRCDTLSEKNMAPEIEGKQSAGPRRQLFHAQHVFLEFSRNCHFWAIVSNKIGPKLASLSHIQFCIVLLLFYERGIEYISLVFWVASCGL